MKKILLLTIFLSSYSWSSGYWVCEARDISLLVQCVRGYMDKGYIPQGGISVAVDGKKQIKSQAMYIE